MFMELLKEIKEKDVFHEFNNGFRVRNPREEFLLMIKEE